MDIQQVRRLNLLKLLQSFNRNEVTERCGWSNVTYLNQMVTSHANIGDKTARKIEAAFRDFNSSDHWMDAPGGASDIPFIQDAVSEFSDDEINDLKNYIEFIRTRRPS